MGFYGNATYYLPNGIAQDVVDGVITTKKLAKDAVTASKIAETAIHGLSTGNNLEKDKNNNPIDKLDEDKKNVIRPSHFAKQTITGEGHNKKKRIVNSQGEIVDSTTEKWPGDIALETITGGDSETKGNIAPNTIQQYNMGVNSIGTDQIIDENITEAKLANTFWRYERFWYDDENVDKDFMKQLDDFMSDNTRKNCNNYILDFNLSDAVTISDDVILPQGTYIGWRQRSGKNYYLNNVTTNECWLCNGSAKKIQKIKIDTDDIALDTITGGSEEGKGNIAGGTIQGYNIHTKTIQGSGVNNGIEQSHIAEKSIGEWDIADNAITSWKIRQNSIVGKNGTLKDVLNKTISHIYSESITGGENGDIASNTITNYNIQPGTISDDRLANTYLEYTDFKNNDGEGINTYYLCEHLKSIKRRQTAVRFSLSNDDEPLIAGDYLAIPLIIKPNEKSDWLLSNLTTKQQWKVDAYNYPYGFSELKNTDVNIAEDAIKDYHIDNNQIHGSGDNLDHPNYQHIAEKSIGTNDIADRAITSNQINAWAVRKEQVAGHAIQGLASDDVFILSDGTKKSHIAPESIAGGENGDIAANTITNYNIKSGTIENNCLAEKYYSHVDATETIANLETLITKLTTLRSDQKFYFSISDSGDLYSYYKLSLSTIYCAEKRLNWIVYPCNTNSNLILNYYIISDLDKTLTPAGIKIGNDFIESYSINGSAKANGESHIAEASIGSSDIANKAIQEKHLANNYIKIKELGALELDSDVPETAVYENLTNSLELYSILEDYLDTMTVVVFKLTKKLNNTDEVKKPFLYANKYYAYQCNKTTWFLFNQTKGDVYKLTKKGVELLSKDSWEYEFLGYYDNFSTLKADDDLVSRLSGKTIGLVQITSAPFVGNGFLYKDALTNNIIITEITTGRIWNVTTETLISGQWTEAKSGAFKQVEDAAEKGNDFTLSLKNHYTFSNSRDGAKGCLYINDIDNFNRECTVFWSPGDMGTTVSIRNATTNADFTFVNPLLESENQVQTVTPGQLYSLPRGSYYLEFVHCGFHEDMEIEESEKLIANILCKITPYIGAAGYNSTIPRPI